MKFGGNEEILDDNLLRTQNKLDRKIPETTAGQEALRRTPKQPRASWKNKNRMIKPGDNVMVGGLPTDIVILCDSIHQFFIISLLTNFSVMGPTGVGKSTVCSSPFFIVILNL